MKFLLEGNSITHEAIVKQIRERVTSTEGMGYLVEATTPQKESGLDTFIDLPDVIFVIHVVPVNKIGENYYNAKRQSGTFFI